MSGMKKKLAILGLSLPLMLAGVACDDAPSDGGRTVDEDDHRVGPGDGHDEIGPFR